MKSESYNKNIDVYKIEKLKLRCEYFQFFDDVHLTIPFDQQTLISETFKQSMGQDF
jgi:hypothetical protein